MAGAEPASSTPLRQRNYSNHYLAVVIATLPATSPLRFHKREEVCVFANLGEAEAFWKRSNDASVKVDVHLDQAIG